MFWQLFHFGTTVKYQKYPPTPRILPSLLIYVCSFTFWKKILPLQNTFYSSLAILFKKVRIISPFKIIWISPVLKDGLLSLLYGSQTMLCSLQKLLQLSQLVVHAFPELHRLLKSLFLLFNLELSKGDEFTCEQG